MFMVASSVVSTILILNYHHRNADTHEMSDWVRVIFLYWLPCLLRMTRPGHDTYSCPSLSGVSNAEKNKHEMHDVELRERYFVRD
jgi:nicotinic acetylcholine receptor